MTADPSTVCRLINWFFHNNPLGIRPDLTAHYVYVFLSCVRECVQVQKVRVRLQMAWPRPLKNRVQPRHRLQAKQWPLRTI